MHSFLQISHEAPRILEYLPPGELKNLSATCRTLRSSFCARITVITMSDLADASKLCCTIWPQLMMVVRNMPLGYQLEAKRKLSAQWEIIMEIELVFTEGFLRASKTEVTLVRSQQQHNHSLIDLPSQHCVALSEFAAEQRHAATWMILRGQPVGCRAVQSLTHDAWPLLTHLRVVNAPLLEEASMSHLVASLPHLQAITIHGCLLHGAALISLGTGWPYLHSLDLSNNQLDATAISRVSQGNWSLLGWLYLNGNVLDTACMQQLISGSWPSLRFLALEHACINAPAVHCLAQGRWPALRTLNLIGNNISAAGVSYLVQGNWPQLCRLMLSDQGLDAEACSLLGIAEVKRSCITTQQEYKPDLPQFSNLTVEITVLNSSG